MNNNYSVFSYTNIPENSSLSTLRSDKFIVHIEIEKHSNMKYEFNKETNKLELDRVLPYPYFYPYAYGFFYNTLGNDGDELDALLITDKKYNSGDIINCKIVGGLVMEDEHGMDEKIFVVPIDDNMYIDLIEEDKNEIHDNIIWFFSNYKNKDKDKWSKVHRIINSRQAINLYNQCYNNYLSTC